MPRTRAVTHPSASVVQLHVPMEQQLMRNWCWAAVAVSVRKFYEPGAAVRQCERANALLERDVCCSENPSPECDRAYYAFNALKDLDVLDLQRRGAAPLTFEQIEQEIRRNRPIVCTIKWNGGGVDHYLCIDGFNKPAQTLSVRDPGYGSQHIRYDVFASAYLGIGKWTEYFVTKPAE